MKPREILITVLASVAALLVLSQFFLFFSDATSGTGFFDKLSLVSSQYSVYIGLVVLAVAYLTVGQTDRVSALAKRVILVIAGLSVLGFVIGIGNGPYGSPGFFGYLSYLMISATTALASAGAIYIILRTDKSVSEGELL